MRLLPVAVMLLAVLSLPGAASADRLPSVNLSVRGAIVDDPKVPGRMSIDGTTVRMGIELRGESSQAFPKKQFSVETERDISPYGMPAEEDWVLSSPYSDKALFRNALAYRTARRMGRYAPRTKLVELRINGDYRGVYIFTESLKLGDDRIPETPGGFLLEMTFPFQAIGEDFFRGPRTRRPIIWQDPDKEDLSRRQRRQVRRQVASFEHTLYARGRRGTSRTIAERIDVDSAVDYVLLHELFRNQDTFNASTYIHRAEDGRIAFGPAWDFDLSLGNTVAKHRSVVGFDSVYRPWGRQLMRDDRFRRQLRARWRELRDRGFRRQFLSDIGAMTRTLRGGPARRNFARWGIGYAVYPNRPGSGGSWKREVSYLRSYAVRRMRWMDRVLR